MKSRRPKGKPIEVRHQRGGRFALTSKVLCLSRRVTGDERSGDSQWNVFLDSKRHDIEVFYGFGTLGLELAPVQKTLGREDQLLGRRQRRVADGRGGVVGRR